MQENALYFYCHRLYLLFALLLLAGLFSPSVYADGGAPQLAYVAGTAKGISVIDIAQRRVTTTITPADSPQTLLLSQDGSALYLAQPASGRVTVIAARTGKPICSARLPGQPSLLALSLDAATLYVAGQGDNSARALDPTNCAIERTFSTYEPIYGLAVTASTAANATPATPNQLWITGSTSLTIFETNGHLLGSIAVAAGPRHICIPAGFTAYVTTREGTTIAIDLSTRRIIQTLLRQGNFGLMDYDVNTGEIYVPDQQHNQLDVLAPVTPGQVPHEPARIIHVGSPPQSVAITSDGQLGFVALSNGQVMMLDIPGRSIVTTIAVGGTPRFIITGLYPPAATPTNISRPTTTSSWPGLYLLMMLVLLATLFLCSSLWLFGKQRRKRMAAGKHHEGST